MNHNKWSLYKNFSGQTTVKSKNSEISGRSMASNNGLSTSLCKRTDVVCNELYNLYSDYSITTIFETSSWT